MNKLFGSKEKLVSVAEPEVDIVVGGADTGGAAADEDIGL